MKPLLAAGALILLLSLPGGSAAAPACEDVSTVGERTIPAGSCVRVGPGGTVIGPVLVDGRLDLAGTPAAPVVISGPIVLRGEPSSLSGFTLTEGATVEIRGANGRRADATLSDGTVASVGDRPAILVADSFRIEILRTTFTGPATAILATFDGRGSSLAISDSTFEGPGAALLATFGSQGGERLALTGNSFRGAVAPGVESFAGEQGLVTLRGQEARGGKPAVVTLSGNIFEQATVALAIESPNYRLLSTGDTFRANDAAVVIGTEGRNAIFDRATFVDNLRYDLVLPSVAEATVKDPVSFDPAKVFVAQGAQVSLTEGRTRTAITYDWVMEHRAATAAGVAGVAILGLGLSGMGRKLLTGMIFLPLYARLSPEQVLNHEKRQEILEFVRANPGAHLRRIGHELAISYGTLTYHLYRLEREGYITFSQEGLFKRYYSSAGRMKEAAKEKPMPTALRDLERSIFDTITASPGSPQSAIAQRLGLSRQALHYHIKKLEKAGYITKVPQGRETLIYATSAALSSNEPAPANT